MNEIPILSLLVFVPAAGALVVALVAERYPHVIKITALTASMFAGALSIWLLIGFDCMRNA